MTIEISVQTSRRAWQHPGVSRIVGIDLGTTNSLVAAVDAGIRLPGVNDDFTGRAPDLGAYERDRPVPHYGPRDAF